MGDDERVAQVAPTTEPELSDYLAAAKPVVKAVVGAVNAVAPYAPYLTTPFLAAPTAAMKLARSYAQDEVARRQIAQEREPTNILTGDIAAPEGFEPGSANNPVNLDTLREPRAAFRTTVDSEGNLTDTPFDPSTGKKLTSKSSSGGGSGSGGSGGPSPIENELRGDYDEQLAAAQRESDARANAATTEAEGLRGVATQERGLAYQGQQQAQAAGQEARRHIDEIGALAAHYAQREIDPDKWWKDKNVPQQIATVVGAMFAGLGGGAQAAMQFVNTRIDRSIALQQGEIDREGHALNQADNLFGNFLKVSGNEQLAYDKTRAALLDSAMTDVAAAGKEAMAPVQQAQIAQLMAAMKRERDMLLAKLGAARQAAGPAQDGWLEIDPKTVVRGMDGEAYHIDNPMLGDDVNNAVVSLRQLDDVLQRGQQLLQNRSAWQAANPYSDARQEGESLYKSAVQLISRFNSARGVPPGMEKIAEGEIPNFGDMTAGLHAAKIPTIRETIRERARETLAGNGARSIDVTDAPGRGKSAGKMTTYARPAAAPTAQAQVQDTKRTYPSATPR